MAKDYTKTADSLLEAIGGRDNIASLTHCATRLRFHLHDSAKADTEQIKKIPGVITVVEKAGQYQVVIGNTVPEVYKAIVKRGGLEGLAPAEEKKKGNILNRLIDTIAGIFPPILGAMCGAGLIKGILAICSAAGWLTPEMGTYVVLNAIGDSIFYFLPVLLGFSAGKKFGGNPYVTALLGCVLIYPDIVSAAGTTITFLKIPMVLLDYSSTVIPILFAAWVCCKLEKWLNDRMPAAINNFITPMICLLVTVPLTLWVIGPVCTWLSNGLANGYQWLYNLSPIVGGAFIGGLWQVLVIFGVHWGFIPVMMNNITTIGYDTLGPMAQIGAMSQTGAAFGLMLKMRNKETRSTTISTVVSGVFGITEPIVYGVTLPRKKPFIMGAIGGAVGGAVGGAIGAAAYSVGALGVFALPAAINPNGIDAGFWGQLIGMVVAFAVAAVLSFVTYKDDTIEEKVSESTLSAANTTVYSPMSGQVLPLSASQDPVHAEEALGKGVLVFPTEGKVYAPFDGTVDMLFDTKHALGLISDDGVELLIHVGVDTVKLGGKHFTAHVEQGQRIERGQLLLEFDIEQLELEGYSLESPIIVTNTDSYEDIVRVGPAEANHGDALLETVAVQQPEKIMEVPINA